MPHLLNSTSAKAGYPRKHRAEKEQHVGLGDLLSTGTERWGSHGRSRLQTTAWVQLLSAVVLIQFCILGHRRTTKEEKTRYYVGERWCGCAGHSQNR